jgi:hypothetical protein
LVRFVPYSVASVVTRITRLAAECAPAQSAAWRLMIRDRGDWRAATSIATAVAAICPRIS